MYKLEHLEEMKCLSKLASKWKSGRPLAADEGGRLKSSPKVKQKTPAGRLGKHSQHHTRAANKHVHIGYLSLLLIFPLKTLKV